MFVRRVACCVVLLLTAAAPRSWAADAAQQRLENSPRHQEWVDVDSGGRRLKCFVVYPEISGKATTVLVIHENKGLTDWVRTVADELAEAGYLAVAPDFLSGAGPGGGNTDAFPSVDAATRAIYELKGPQVLADLDAAAAYAKTLDAANGKVAVAGFCWGGGQSFAYAAHSPQVAAACVFYGTAPDEAAMKNIKAPVYGFYGGNDARITGQVPAVAARLKALGKTYEPVVYEGAGHGFMRAGSEESASPADKKAHDEAWTRWKKILAGL
jgi:carboxymethylenebutenolidase